VMNISTAAKSGSRSSPRLPHGAWLLLPGMLVGIVASRRRNRRLRVGVTGALIVLATILLASCSGVSSSGGGGNPPQNPITYQVTVTGTSPGTPADSGQSVVVALVVD